MDKSQIETGLLRDYDIDFLNLDNYIGAILHDSNFVSMDEWRLLYASLYSAQINNNAQSYLPYLDTINNRAKRYSYPDQPVTFAVLYYHYQGLKPDVITNNLMSVSNDQLYDVPGRTESPYQMNMLFAVAPARQAVLTGTVQLMFRPDMFFGNTGKTVSSLQIDPKGTGAYQTVTMNAPVGVNYDTSGFYTIHFRITYTDGTVRVAHSKLAVYKNPNAGVSIARYGERPTTQANIRADKAYLGAYADGDITIELSEHNTTGQICKPLIVAEGFDPYNSYTYREFTNSMLSDEHGNYISLNDDLDDIGQYDLVFVNWHNSVDYIQRNAYLLEKVIDTINQIKTTFNGVRQQNVVLGLSMGGLVVRYALRDMELNGKAHECRLFVSHDTPFWGANVPVAAQALVQQLAPWKIVDFTWSRTLYWRDLIPTAADGLDLLNSPAARQMLIQYFYINQSGPTAPANLVEDNSVHNAFMNELNQMGWPQQCKIMTLSNGSCSGATPFPDNSTLFTLSGNRSMSYLDSLWRSLVSTVLGGTANAGGLVYGWSTPVNTWKEFWQFPLALFSTNASVKLDFWGKAVPSTTSYEIYRGDAYSRRRILGIIDVNTYFVKCHLNSTAGMLPLDNAPGGEYNVNQFGLDIDQIQDNLPAFFQGYVQATVLQPIFCFVPTVSSLAFNDPQRFLFSNVCSEIACDNASAISDYYAPSENQSHISYTQANGDWLMQVQDISFNCFQICNSAFQISGVDNLCSSSVYNVSGVPNGSTVAWSTFPSNVVSLNPNGNQVTVTKIANGNVTLKATITNACNMNNNYNAKTINVGVPLAANITAGRASGTGSMQDIPFYYNGLSYYIPNGDNYFDFHSLDRHNIYGQPPNRLPVTPPFEAKGAEVIVDVNSGNRSSIYMSVSAHNVCGYSDTRNFTIPLNQQYYYKVNPNPASGTITIAPELINAQYSKIGITDNQSFIKDVKIYTSSSNMVKQQQFNGNISQVQMDVSSLSPGIYFVKISDGQYTETQKLVISR